MRRWRQRGRQALTRVIAQAARGVATVAVYMALGILLAVGAVPLAVAGTAVLAIRSAQASLATLLYSVNQTYEEGLYFSDYLAFCADAARRIAPPGRQAAPEAFGRITTDRITFAYPGAAAPGAVRGQRRDPPRRGGRAGRRERLGQDHAGQDPGRTVPAAERHVRWDETDLGDVDAEPLRERSRSSPRITPTGR